MILEFVGAGMKKFPGTCTKYNKSLLFDCRGTFTVAITLRCLLNSFTAPLLSEQPVPCPALVAPGFALRAAPAATR